MNEIWSNDFIKLSLALSEAHITIKILQEENIRLKQELESNKMEAEKKKEEKNDNK